MFDDLNTNIETERGALGRAAWAALRLTLLTLSALTTAAFFIAYAGGIFTDLVGPDLSPYLAALTGVIVLEGGALTWSYLRAHHASTVGQMATAQAAAVGDLAGSLLTSVLYLALSSSFDAGVYTAAGGLTTLGQALHYTGLAVVVAGIAGNFAATYIYTSADARVRAATQDRQLEALAASARYAADRQRLEMTTAAALQAIAAQLPDLATLQGNQAGGAYLAATMTAARKPAGAVNADNLAPVVIQPVDTPYSNGRIDRPNAPSQGQSNARRQSPG